MIRISGLFSVLLAVMTSSAAVAEDCSNAQTQTEMNICADKQYKQADAALNTAYGKAMDRLPPKAQDRLRKAQKAWIAFRDAECDFRAAGSKGGSIYPTLIAGCMEDLTKRRTADLRSLADCDEGSCPY